MAQVPRAIREASRVSPVIWICSMTLFLSPSRLEVNA
jgi:hypothetical protein